MAAVVVKMPDGREWTPRFVKEIDQEKCIGCGRCVKVCGRDVLQLAGMDDEGHLTPVSADPEEQDDDEYERMVMTIANQMNCVGCEACMKICPKKCYTHEEMTE